MTLVTTDLGKINISSDTGSGAISDSIPIGDQTVRKMMSVSVHLNAAPTSAGSVTVTLNNNLGAAYDLLLNTQSMIAVTDYLWQPDYDVWLLPGDSLDIAYANPDSKTFGLTVLLAEQ